MPRPSTAWTGFIVDKCMACGGTSLELALRLAPTPIADRYIPSQWLHKVQEKFSLDLYLCHTCGDLQLSEVISSEELYSSFAYVTSSSPGLAEHFRNYALGVGKRFGIRKGSLVVDIGSNDGTLLRFFKRNGMRVLGVEPGQDIAREATKSGIETLQAFFDMALGRQIFLGHGPAKLVTANNTLANIPVLREFLKGLTELLAADGVFVFETGYLVDLLQKSIVDNIYHEHLHYFSVRPLSVLFEAHGLELFDVERIPSKGGSLRGFVQHAGGPRPTSPAIADLMAMESDIAIDQVKTFRDFASRLSTSRSRLSSLLDKAEGGGKCVAGYGASHSVTTLAHHFELGERLSFVVDDNPSKQGLFTPGFHTPVLASDAIYERSPDYVVVLVWRFAETIIKKHQAYLDQGGHFIVPLPHVEVV